MTEFEETLLDRMREIAFALDKLSTMLEDALERDKIQAEDMWEPTAHED